MTEGRLRFGDMLCSAGLITQAQLQSALDAQKSSGRRLGEELVAAQVLTEVQVTQVLSNQLSVPWVSLYHVEFSRELLNLVPAELADRFCVVPIYKREVRRKGQTLFVALDDPTNEVALDAIEQASGLPVRAMVAPPTEIREAIRVYYFGGKGPRAAEPSVPAASNQALGSAKPPAPPPPPPPRAAHVAAASARPPASPSDEAEASESSEKTSKRRASRPPKMVTITLLDGTSVCLPAPSRGGGDDEQEAGLTAADLVSALMARAQGRDVSKVLPDQPIEGLLATVISLLLRKGLVADWEFVEEWQKRGEK